MPKKAPSKKDSRFRSNLLAVISHELNTPISAIMNATDLLAESGKSDPEALAMVRRNAERLQRTVRNLMEIARVDAGALRVRLSELDFTNFVRMRAEALRARLTAEKFTVELSIEDDLPHACGDLIRLAHVFDSLVLNAAKFSNREHAAKGVISVETKLEAVAKLPKEFRDPNWEKKTGLYLVTSIQSSLPAIGESPKHFEELFEPFTPWRDADSRQKEGLGVELALAKEILLAHEGFIWADTSSDKKRGWKFYFALPMLSRSDELNMVLANRLFTSIGALSKVSLLLLRPGPGAFSDGGRSVMDVIKTVQRLLFRSSDSIFWIEEAGELTVLMDDCDEIGARRVGERITSALSETLPGLSFMWSIVTGPEDGSSADELLEKARERWQPAL
jgi:nitrogen-specific signal transduction histidine kinase